jgi:hypothetical protein
MLKGRGRVSRQFTYLEDRVLLRRRGSCSGNGCRRALGGLPDGALGHHGQRHGDRRPAAPPGRLAAGRRRLRGSPPAQNREPARTVAITAEADVSDVARVLSDDGAVGAARDDHGPRLARHAHRRRRLRPAQHSARPHRALSLLQTASG